MSTTTGTLQIGIFADNLRLPLRDGVRKAAELGVASFQMFTTSGEVLPDNMSKAQRAEFRRFYQDQGLKLSATCADFGHGFVDPEKNKELIPALFKQVDLAVDLGTSIITTHIGALPEQPNEVWDIMRAAISEIGKYAEEHGISLATETGPESGPVLRDFLQSIDNTGVKVNLDPANLTMAGFDLDEAVDALLPYIVHTHAKDGYTDPGKWREAPLGQGDVNWPNYIARLKAAGYHGAFTIEREVGEDPIGDIQKAIDFLRQF
ncbi:MAG: sugar phosphate isomerase/epimerase family protein [Armatimonadota bacterium]